VQLHAMSVNLLAHHLQARLLGLAITALTAGLLLTAVRRIADRPHQARSAAVIQRARR
jgi:hypothetical protein